MPEDAGLGRQTNHGRTDSYLCYHVVVGEDRAGCHYGTCIGSHDRNKEHASGIGFGVEVQRRTSQIMINIFNILLHGVSYKGGLCHRFTDAADDLIREAKKVRSELEEFSADPNPLAALAATAHNNQEFDLEMDREVSMRNLKRATG
jgi:hypothetical protein